MRTFSAIYRYARRVMDHTLPLPPTYTVKLHTEGTSRDGMGLDELPDWFRQLDALPNPIRRAFHELTLLTGSRPEALSKARFEHLDIKRRLWRIPEPKGGKSRAFDIPLSRPILRCLVRVRRDGRFLVGQSPWIFPSVTSHHGHIAEWSEDRAKLSAWGRDLRKTFRNVCATLGIYQTYSMVLMNHKLPGVHNKYLTAAKIGKPLHDAQDKISAAINNQRKPFGDHQRSGVSLRSTDNTEQLNGMVDRS